MSSQASLGSPHAGSSPHRGPSDHSDLLAEPTESQEPERNPVSAKVHEYFYGTGRFFTRSCDRSYAEDRATWLGCVEPHYTHSAGCILVPDWKRNEFPVTDDWPLPVELLQAALTNHGGFISIWQSRAIDAVYLANPPRFYVQSPADDDYVAFGACHSVGDRFAGLLITADEQSKSLCYNLEVPVEWERTSLPLALVPLKLLQHRWARTSQLVWDLMQAVEKIETAILVAPTVMEDDESALPDMGVRELHRCNSELLKLERRWHFETKLAAAILAVVRESRDAGFESLSVGSAYQKISTEAITLSQSIRALEPGLTALPRRIRNTLTALYNLNAQRDTKATIALAAQSREIAKQSQEIAAATLRDSSAMKTIAAMTLIFLPATFLCSFFSMSFFDWHSAPNDTVAPLLWVYFAVVVPLTVIVAIGWVILNPYMRRRFVGWLRGKGRAEKEKVVDVEGKLA